MPNKPDWLEPLFPWPQQRRGVNGRQMAFVDEGPRSGRPVLLLHGNPTWGFLYRDFVGPLTAAGYRVIVPDCIGAGYSDKPRTDAAYSLAHHIADLVSLIDQLDLTGLAIVGQDWGGPQGVGAALRRLKRLKTHSHGGPSNTTRRGMTAEEARGYHHVYDERESETVTLTWPRSIPLREGDRGWADMAWIQSQLPRLADIPIQLIWAPEDQVFPIEYADRLKALLPHAEGPKTYDKAAHFLQDDRGPEIAADLVAFLDRTVGPGL
jgi:pimeloyl-ACP methyl ester carboxylesterase